MFYSAHIKVYDDLMTLYMLIFLSVGQEDENDIMETLPSYSVGLCFMFFFP